LTLTKILLGSDHHRTPQVFPPAAPSFAGVCKIADALNSANEYGEIKAEAR
jgi:hypothetical protein